jgi:hypothetical protein
MSSTARLSLPYIAPQQAQKQVTYNTAMAALDQLVQPVVKSRTLAAPPASPADGDLYVVAPAATGAWAGKEHRFASWLDGGWSFRTPSEGWLAFVVDTGELAVFRAGAWGVLVSGASVAKFGINATADLTNRLAVAAHASLFTHDGTSHRMAINKASAAQTASLLFNDNFSGRAEIGLTGDDALRVKVSANGTSWTEALNIAPASGVVGLPIGQLAFPAVANPSNDPTTLDDYREGVFTPTVQFGGASTGITYGSPTLGRYTRIGRVVVATISVTLTSKGTATGPAQIGGLPFSSLNDGNFACCAFGYAAGFSSVTGAVMGMVNPGTPRINLYHSANGASAGLSNANFGATTAISLTVVYDAQ